MPDPLKKQVRMLFAPWNYYWSRSKVQVVRQTGVIELPTEMADAAIAQGMAEPVRKRAQGTRASTARKAATKVESNETAEPAKSDDVDGADLAGDDSAED